MNATVRYPALGALAALTLAACSATADVAPSATPTAIEPQITVTAAFYPLEYAAKQVGGKLVQVNSLTAPGVEPHDLEISPAAVRTMGNSDIVIYLEGFQPAVDAAVAQLEGVTVINVADYIDLLEYQEHGHDDEDGHEDDEHGDEDPHFWLDANRFALLAPVLSEAFAAVDAANADTYTAGAEAFVADMAALDAEYTTALSQCSLDVIVVSHGAFGYLANLYGFEQVGLSGISPDAEPSPARLREVREIVEHEGVKVIFFETLVSSAVATTFASDLGVSTAVLDPIEGLVNDNDDYRSVMNRNRDALVEGLDCN